MRQPLRIVFCLALLISIHAAGAESVGPANPPPPGAAEATVHISGRLREKGTRKVLADVNVFVLPMKIKLTTDARGEFAIDLPPGDFSWVVNSTGYQKLELPDRAHTGQEEPKRDLFLKRVSYLGSFETTITGKADTREASARTMEASQFMTAPGAQGDPVKAVQNMPGVARVAGFSSQVVIQGSAPQDTGYLLENHEVPLIFHFGGITSIVTPEAIESVDYLSAGFGPEYGRVDAGLVGLHLRDPATDRTKGFAFLDFEKTGGLVEGPIDDHSSYLVTGRYSYLGVLLGAALKGNSAFNLTVAPAFYDLTMLYKNQLSPRDEFRLVMIGSHDELGFVFNQPANQDPAIRGNFDDQTVFYRIIPEWTHRHDENNVSRWSLGLGQQQVLIDVGSIYANVYQTSFTQRGELESKLSGSWTSYLGFDNALTYTTDKLNLPDVARSGGVSSPISGSALQQSDASRFDIDPALYLRNSIHEGGSRWTHGPSLRLDYFSQTHEILPEPRLAEKYEIDPGFSWKGATGLYYQPPQLSQIAPDVGNPGLSAERAVQFMFGFDKDLRQNTDRGFEISSDVFYKVLDRLVIPSKDPSILYSNDGSGKAYGLEAQIKYTAKPWTTWLVYTLSRSLRTEPETGEHLFNYDQTHNLNLMAMVDLSDTLKMSMRFRYTTGDPYTPVTSGVFDADNDVYDPIRGSLYASRMPGFLQADVRFDKKWVYQTWILSFYADIQNVTNQKNTQSIRYSYDYSQTSEITDLPILPILGLRGDF